MMYNWQQPDWTQFSYDPHQVEEALYTFAEKSGRISGALDAMPEDDHTQTIIEILVAEAIKTSEIEGEYVSRKDVTSSIRHNLGLNVNLEQIQDKSAKGIADLITDVQHHYDKKLDEKTLFTWHTMIFPGKSRMRVGGWRTHTEPMQVVSGAIGREIVHFEAPPSSQVPEEMRRFITWFNETAPSGIREIKHAPIRSAIAHLYFETIHPFEDGNGRVGRAIAEKALSQTVGYPVVISLSATIEEHKKHYYEALKSAQRSNEITSWLIYFIDVILKGQQASEARIDFTLKKTRFFDRYGAEMNERQLKVVKRMLKEGTKEFKGGMTAKKYVRITRTSKPTATRDLQKLLEMGALRVSGGGRSTSYQLNLV